MVGEFIRSALCGTVSSPPRITRYISSPIRSPLLSALSTSRWDQSELSGVILVCSQKHGWTACLIISLFCHFVILWTTLYVYFLYAWLDVCVYLGLCSCAKSSRTSACNAYLECEHHRDIPSFYIYVWLFICQGFRIFVFIWVYVSSFFFIGCLM